VGVYKVFGYHYCTHLRLRCKEDQKEEFVGILHSKFSSTDFKTLLSNKMNTTNITLAKPSTLQHLNATQSLAIARGFMAKRKHDCLQTAVFLVRLEQSRFRSDSG